MSHDGMLVLNQTASSSHTIDKKKRKKKKKKGTKASGKFDDDEDEPAELDPASAALLAVMPDLEDTSSL